MNNVPWFFVGAVGFAALIAIGWVVSSRLYRLLGYPTDPPFLNRVSLSDEIETIRAKVEADEPNEYVVREHSEESLVLQKSFERPASVMLISFLRPLGIAQWNSTTVKVKCAGRPWLNRSSSTASNCIRRPRPAAQTKKRFESVGRDT